MDSTFFLTLGMFLIGLGFLLLVAELFIPSGGILFVLSVSSIAVGIAFVFSHDTTTGLLTLLGVGVALPVLGALLLYLWPRTRLGRRLFLPPSPADDTVAAMAHNQELEALKGRFGKTISALRPAGVVDFDGRRVDSLTEGMMVEPGRWVRCIDVRAGRVLVRPVEKPTLGDLETAVFN
jgi:membrane-bound serine protease (ClpP class)